MAKIYYNLIKLELKTLADVPEKWFEEVKQLLEKDLIE